MNDSVEIVPVAEVDRPQYLIGIRLREPAHAGGLPDHRGFAPRRRPVLVETGGGTAVAEVRRPGRPLPEFKRGRLYRRVVRRATEPEAAEWRERHARELEGIATCRAPGARAAGSRSRSSTSSIEPSRRRVTVFFNSEERVDFRDLVRELAHEFHARIEMRQIGSRDTTKLHGRHRPVRAAALLLAPT